MILVRTTYTPILIDLTLLEGALTCIVAVILFFFIPDFPEDVKWLSAEEQRFIKARLAEDVGDSQRHKPLTFRDAFNIIRECEDAFRPW